MKKRITCSAACTIAAMLMVSCLSAYAVDAPEEVAEPCATTVTTTCSSVTSKKVETSITTTSMAVTETTAETTTAATTTQPVISETTISITETEPVVTEEFLVYKPSTKYIHRSTCRWCKDDIVLIDNTNDIIARKCTECNPDIEIVNEYVEPVPETVAETEPVTEIVVETETEPVVEETTYSISDDERYYLASIVEHEAGSDWIGTYSKACVVAVVMNRVNSPNFPDSIYGVLTQPSQFSGFYFGNSPSQSCYDAVDYYFSHRSEFSTGILYFYGDGYNNYFY